MLVLVIGGSGFIGSHVVDRLLGDGIGVRVLDPRPESFRPTPRGVDLRLGTLMDRETVDAALRGVDAVAHLATTNIPSTAEADPAADVESNLVPTLRLLEAMRSAGVGRIPYLSSGGTVYGHPEADPIPESHPLRPTGSYGIVKVAVEAYLEAEHRRSGLSPIVLRPSNPYGPRQSHQGKQGVIGTFLWSLANQQPVEIWGDGSVVRDFVEVRDLADLCVRALLSDRSGCYNAGSGHGTSIARVESIARSVATASGLAPLPAIHLPSRALDIPRVVLDISRARADFGWWPRTSLEEGIQACWQWALDAAGEPDAITGRPARAAGQP